LILLTVFQLAFDDVDIVLRLHFVMIGSWVFTFTSVSIPNAI